MNPDESGDDLVTICAVSTEFEAQLIVAMLSDAGIDAVAFPIGAGVFPMVMAPSRRVNKVPVQVRSADATRATAILAERRGDGDDEAEAVDWDQVDVGDRVDRVPLGETTGFPLSVRLIALVALVLLGGSCIVGVVLSAL